MSNVVHFETRETQTHLLLLSLTGSNIKHAPLGTMVSSP